MGTFVVGAILVIVVCLIVRSMIHDKKNGKSLQCGGDKIGTATVYRMVNTLEEIGAISRKNMYRITCDQGCEMENACTIEFDDNTIVELSSSKWNQIIQSGLLACGYLNGHHVRSIMAKSYE